MNGTEVQVLDQGGFLYGQQLCSMLAANGWGGAASTTTTSGL